MLIASHKREQNWVICRDMGASQGTQLVKNPLINVGDSGDRGSIPELERSPEEGNGNSLKYSCLENSKDRGAWWATVHAVAKSQTGLSMHAHVHSFPHPSVRFCLFVSGAF